MRQVARHVWVAEVLSGQYEEKKGWEPNVLHTGRGPVSRVNIIGSLVSHDGQTVLDDGTGQVSLRAFEDIPGLSVAKVGLMVLVVGRPRKYGDQVYVIPEIIREVDAAWAAHRKESLGGVKEFSAPAQTEPAPPAPAGSDNAAERLIEIISGLDSGEGAEVDVVVEQSGLGERAEKILHQLLLDGDIFEIRPGVVKVL